MEVKEIKALKVTEKSRVADFRIYELCENETVYHFIGKLEVIVKEKKIAKKMFFADNIGKIINSFITFYAENLGKQYADDEINTLFATLLRINSLF